MKGVLWGVGVCILFAFQGTLQAWAFTDLDNDGYCPTITVDCPNQIAVDCDDEDPAVNPGAPEICDGKDSNCDGYQAPTDVDQDGDGSAWCAGDCNDTDPAVHPGAAELCNGIDDNCDGIKPGEADTDGDGVKICDVPSDCNDYDVSIYPGGIEICGDKKDNDCDGKKDNADPEGCGCPDADADGFTASLCGGTDCNDADPAIRPTAVEVCDDGIDNNCDGLTDSVDQVNCPLACPDADVDGFYDAACAGGNDCDDTDANIHPGAPEVCDGKDSNCDGYQASTDVDQDGDGTAWCAGDCDDTDPARHPGAAEICNGIDDNCDGILPGEADTDGDGVKICDVPSDCNDYDATTYPGAVEICGDHKDNDCDGKKDQADPEGCGCPDADADGFTSSACGGTDCNDADPTINPTASEICDDGIDNNCDGLTDSADQVNCPLACPDVDVDGFYDAACTGGNDCDDTDPNVYPGAPEVCDGKDSNCDGYQAPTDVDSDGDGTAWCAGDCDDTDPSRHPGVVELCNGIDDDCDGILSGEADSDGDGFKLCDVPSDCNDFDASIYPGSVEVCDDGKDNDCDGKKDAADPEGCGCPDADGDSYTNSICGGLDCNDADPAINPGAAEVCDDGIDNNCDGKTDYEDQVVCPLNCPDVDADGYYDNACTGGTDCDDLDPTVHPGTAEICDGKDTNCDGYQAFTDVDQDGDSVAWCAGDCDDTDPARFPGNLEICDDSIDNDCDTLTDLADVGDCVGSCVTGTSPKDPPHHGTLLNPDDTTHPDESVLQCGKCHYADELGNTVVGGERHCQRCHVDPKSPADPLNGVLKGQYPAPYPYGFGSAPDVATHSSQIVGTKYGVWEADCLNCHNPHSQEQNNKYSTSYGKLIKKYICFDNDATGGRTEGFVRFTSATGAGSFADGVPYAENICNTCHTRTSHHQNDGTAPGGQTHNDGQNCITCHPHSEGFKPSCNSCHQAPPTSGTHLKHFGGNSDLANYGTTEAAADLGGDGTQYIFNCGNCHPLDPASHMNGVPNSGGGMAEIELFNPAAPAGSLKALNPASATYTPGGAVIADAQGFTYTQGSCSDVYCHSGKSVATTAEIPIPTLTDGTWPLLYDPPWEDFVVISRDYKNPQWGVDSLGCSGCHGNPITTQYPTVSAGAGDSHYWINDFGEGDLHTWNMTFGPLQCKTCHHDTIQADGTYTQTNLGITAFDDMPIHDRKVHVNGRPDIIFTPDSIVYPASLGNVTYNLNTASYNNETKTCSNVPCHKFQTEVVWGNPYRYWENKECDVCHHVLVR